MNILVLFSQNEEILVNVIVKGFVKLGYHIGNDLITYPNNVGFYRSDDDICSIGLPMPEKDYKPQDIATMLSANRFDLIIMGSIWRVGFMNDVYNHILSCAGSIPCIIISEHREYALTEWTNSDMTGINLLAYFHSNSKEGENSIPIPFYALEEDCYYGEKSTDTFFAGASSINRHFYLDKLIKAGYKDIYSYKIVGSKSEYHKYLRQSRVGFGIYMSDLPQSSNRFRHLEVSSQGSCLLMKTPDLQFRQIHEFEDGISAIYYNDPDDLLEKLNQILKDEDRLNQIAKNGYDHIMKNHLDYQGAQYVLDVIEERLRGK